MARTKRRSKHKFVAPAERTFWIYPPSNVTANDFYYLDMAQLLSKTNRRGSYRQGMQYVVENIELFGKDSTIGLEMNIAALPNTWVVANSWVKGYALWKKQQDEALMETGQMSTVARHRDFKIFMEENHANIGNYNSPVATVPGANLSPDGYIYDESPQLVGISADATMEYEPSQVVVPNDGGVVGASVEYHMYMVGDETSSGGSAKGMVVAYAQSRSRPFQTDPNVVGTGTATSTGGLFEDMFDVGDNLEDVVYNARATGNQPPYAIDANSVHEFYPGGANQGAGGNMIVDVLSVRAGATIASDNSGPFVANCGLLRLNFAGDWYSNETYHGVIKVTLAAGDYHGVMARPMKDVN